MYFVSWTSRLFLVYRKSGLLKLYSERTYIYTTLIIIVFHNNLTNTVKPVYSTGKYKRGLFDRWPLFGASLTLFFSIFTGQIKAGLSVQETATRRKLFINVCQGRNYLLQPPNNKVHNVYTSTKM